MALALDQARQGAEEQFSVRVRIAMRLARLGRQLEIVHAWLHERCRIECWARAPADLASVINNAITFSSPGSAAATA